MIKAQDLPETETQIVEVDDQTSKIIAKRVTATTTGLIFSEETPFEEWEQIYATYSIIREKSNWFVGDCLRFGERFGERYAQAVHITDKSYSYLTTIVWVANQFRDLSRRHEDLPFSWHEAVAALPPQTADTILAEGKRKHWTRDDIRDAAAKARGLPTTAQKRAAKEAKKNGGVTLLPPAANSEPEKAPASSIGIYWNGYQLSTRERLLYYGAERLPEEECDKCAHHHGFAHAEALMNWLETNGFTQQPERKEGDEPCPSNPNPSTTETQAQLAHAGKNDSESTQGASSIEGSNSASVVQPDAAPNSTEPAAPEATSACPEPALVTPQPELIPTPRTPAQRAEEALATFITITGEVDWETMGKLERKKWLKLLVPVDALIDVLANPPSPKK